MNINIQIESFDLIPRVWPKLAGFRREERDSPAKKSFSGDVWVISGVQNWRGGAGRPSQSSRRQWRSPESPQVVGNVDSSCSSTTHTDCFWTARRRKERRSRRRATAARRGRRPELAWNMSSSRPTHRQGRTVTTAEKWTCRWIPKQIQRQMQGEGKAGRVIGSALVQRRKKKQSSGGRERVQGWREVRRRDRDITREGKFSTASLFLFLLLFFFCKEKGNFCTK